MFVLFRDHVCIVINNPKNHLAMMWNQKEHPIQTHQKLGLFIIYYLNGRLDYSSTKPFCQWLNQTSEWTGQLSKSSKLVNSSNKVVRFMRTLRISLDARENIVTVCFTKRKKCLLRENVPRCGPCWLNPRLYILIQKYNPEPTYNWWLQCWTLKCK